MKAKWKKLSEVKSYGETTREYQLIMNDTETNVFLETCFDGWGNVSGNIYWKVSIGLDSAELKLCEELVEVNVPTIKKKSLRPEFLKSIFTKIYNFMSINDAAYEKLQKAIG